MFPNETKDGARKRARREYEQKTGIKLGTHVVMSAKEKNKGRETGRCINCGEKPMFCRCDDRNEWTKQRIGGKI